MSLGAEIPEETTRCQIVDIRELIAMSEIISLYQAAWGPRPFLIAPAVFAAETLCIATWRPGCDSMQLSPIGQALQEMCLERPESHQERQKKKIDFDCMYVAMIIRYGGQSITVDDLRQAGRDIEKGVTRKGDDGSESEVEMEFAVPTAESTAGDDRLIGAPGGSDCAVDDTDNSSEVAKVF